MKVRGERECRDCGTQWSYYETGSVTCPNCGSLRSTGTDERTSHTDAGGSLDLTEARNRVDSDGLLAAASAAVESCREYGRRTGFINAGELQPLSETYLAARELVAVGREYEHAMRIEDDEELYLLALLRSADFGERPEPEAVPERGRGARNLAYATAIEDYRSDCRTYLDEHPDEDAARALGLIVDHVRRVEALDGNLDLAVTETLIRAVREIGEYLREGDETALVTAQSRLEELS